MYQLHGDSSSSCLSSPSTELRPFYQAVVSSQQVQQWQLMHPREVWGLNWKSGTNTIDTPGNVHQMCIKWMGSVVWQILPRWKREHPKTCKQIGWSFGMLRVHCRVLTSSYVTESAWRFSIFCWSLNERYEFRHHPFLVPAPKRKQTTFEIWTSLHCHVAFNILFPACGFSSFLFASMSFWGSPLLPDRHQSRRQALKWRICQGTGSVLCWPEFHTIHYNINFL